jgi:multiple antibiotic resistance protein
MLAGPGSISTVIVLMGEAGGHWWQVIPVFAAIAVTSMASYAVLAAADRVRKYLGQTGIRIMMRFMGLLLMGVAIQFILNGFTDVGLIHQR